MFLTGTTVGFVLLKYLKYLDNHNGFIAGGCFKDIFLKRPPKDLDIFFESMDEFVKADTYFSSNQDYFQVYETKKVRAFKEKSTGTILELNRFVFGTPEEVLSKFDFTICKYALYSCKTLESSEYKVIYSHRFFEDLLKNSLVIDDKCDFPLSTFNRCFKYAKKGFFPCTETKKKLVKSIKQCESGEDEIPQSFYDGID